MANKPMGPEFDSYGQCFSVLQNWRDHRPDDGFHGGSSRGGYAGCTRSPTDPRKWVMIVLNWELFDDQNR
jgi:hypothetical protein